MRITKISAIEQTDSVDNADNKITRILNPLLILMRIIGIGLYSSNSGTSYLYSLPNKSFKSKVFSVLGYFIFLIILAIHVLSMLNLLNAEKKGFLEISSTFLMSRILDQLNHSSRIVGIHICFLIFVRRHWNKVWRSINVIGRFKYQFNTILYHRFVLLSLLGIVYTFFVVIIVIIFFVLEQQNLSWLFFSLHLGNCFIKFRIQSFNFFMATNLAGKGDNLYHTVIDNIFELFLCFIHLIRPCGSNWIRFNSTSDTRRKMCADDAISKSFHCRSASQTVETTTWNSLWLRASLEPLVWWIPAIWSRLQLCRADHTLFLFDLGTTR